MNILAAISPDLWHDYWYKAYKVMMPLPGFEHLKSPWIVHLERHPAQESSLDSMSCLQRHKRCQGSISSQARDGGETCSVVANIWLGAWWPLQQRCGPGDGAGADLDPSSKPRAEGSCIELRVSQCHTSLLCRFACEAREGHLSWGWIDQLETLYLFRKSIGCKRCRDMSLWLPLLGEIRRTIPHLKVRVILPFGYRLCSKDNLLYACIFSCRISCCLWEEGIQEHVKERWGMSNTS